MIYNLKGGGRIEAETSEEFVRKLNEISWFGYRENIHIFMNETAKACKVQTGAEIRTDSYTSFLNDLLANGYAEIVHAS